MTEDGWKQKTVNCVVCGRPFDAMGRAKYCMEHAQSRGKTKKTVMDSEKCTDCRPGMLCWPHYVMEHGLSNAMQEFHERKTRKNIIPEPDLEKRMK